MSVHKDLIQHAEKQNKAFREFLLMDQQREGYIEEVISLCRQGKPFSTNKINEVSLKINAINLRIIPERKIVTEEMVRKFVLRSERS